MSDKYYTVSLNGIYLSSDGTGSGLGCKLSETGFSTLSPNYAKTKYVDINRNPIYMKQQVDKRDRQLELSILTLPTSVGEDLLDLRDDQDENDTEIIMSVSHDEFPDYDLDVEIDDIIYSEGRNGRWNNVIIKVTTYEEA